MLHPESEYITQTLPTKMFEYMAAGIPVKISVMKKIDANVVFDRSIKSRRNYRRHPTEEMGNNGKRAEQNAIGTMKATRSI
ncbi:hypothetical protein MHB50_17760 [Siminovitchia sp. FSL H7-0308]|uniref:hypothetical protein n=1 Tax=Siminovitchia sp. FSL H7-0308 TaxID=2921432 RepID=UPI0030EC21F3